MNISKNLYSWLREIAGLTSISAPIRSVQSNTRKIAELANRRHIPSEWGQIEEARARGYAVIEQARANGFAKIEEARVAGRTKIEESLAKDPAEWKSVVEQQREKRASLSTDRSL